MGLPRIFLVLCAVVVAGGCAGGRVPHTATKAAPAQVAREGPAEAYPDPATTPGIANPEITQDNIAETICSKFWRTSSVRPPSTYTTKLKLQQLNALGLTGHAAEYEEDHFLPLEVGGHPRDPGNLWPEPWTMNAGADDCGAHTKDLVESFIHDEVCWNIPNHKVSSSKKYRARVSISLARGQEIITTDWYACFHRMQAGQPCQ
jgi:hypothetical protein